MFNSSYKIFDLTLKIACKGVDEQFLPTFHNTEKRVSKLTKGAIKTRRRQMAVASQSFFIQKPIN